MSVPGCSCCSGIRNNESLSFSEVSWRINEKVVTLSILFTLARLTSVIVWQYQPSLRLCEGAEAAFVV